MFNFENQSAKTWNYNTSWYYCSMARTDTFNMLLDQVFKPYIFFNLKSIHAKAINQRCFEERRR